MEGLTAPLEHILSFQQWDCQSITNDLRREILAKIYEEVYCRCHYSFDNESLEIKNVIPNQDARRVTFWKLVESTFDGQTSDVFCGRTLYCSGVWEFLDNHGTIMYRNLRGRHRDGSQLNRIYINSFLEDRIGFVVELVDYLRLFRRFFDVKCFWNSRRRADNIVVYVVPADTNEILDLLTRFVNRRKTVLSATLPMFTKVISGRLGFAESPLNNESFGMHMSKVLLSISEKVRFYSDSRTSAVDIVRETLDSSNVDEKHMFMRKDSPWKYNFL